MPECCHSEPEAHIPCPGRKRNEGGAIRRAGSSEPQREARSSGPVFQVVPISPSGAKRPSLHQNFLRKEVIQPQVPLRLPCYDFTPVAEPTVVSCPLAVGALPSGKPNSHGVTGGVYKARERIHRVMLLRDY